MAPKLPIWFLLSSAVATGVASAQNVNFADAGSPVTLGGYFYLDATINGPGSVNRVTHTYTPDVTPPYSPGTVVEDSSSQLYDTGFILFSGVIAPDQSFSFTLSDGGEGLSHQFNLMLMNYTQTDWVIAAHSLRLGITGLYSLTPGEALASGFEFVNGTPTLNDALVAAYDAQTGEVYLTNSAEITVPGGDELIDGHTHYLDVNFVTTAIPEPSAFAALAGLGALALVSTRRRRA